MVVGVFGDAHAHAEALDAVIGAAEACGVHELWSLGDMSAAVRSIKLARERLSGAAGGGLLSPNPGARRGEVQCYSI